MLICGIVDSELRECGRACLSPGRLVIVLRAAVVYKNKVFPVLMDPTHVTLAN